MKLSSSIEQIGEMQYKPISIQGEENLRGEKNERIDLAVIIMTGWIYLERVKSSRILFLQLLVDNFYIPGMQLLISQI